MKISNETRNRWEYLCNHFTPEYILNMTDKKEYVLGFGPSNKSFCYLVEAGTKELGEIRGANASKFGLWYGTYGKDETIKFRATKKHYGKDPDVAFGKIKIELARLIKETKALTTFEDIESDLITGMFKYKIMYLYNPEIMIPTFVLDDLQHFQESLGLTVSKTFERAQNSLLEYRKSHHPRMDNHSFMVSLYKTYGSSPYEKQLNESVDDRLNKLLWKEKVPEGQHIPQAVEKVKLKKSPEGVYYYPRNPKTAAIALKQADYKCERNENHECFIRRSNELPYTEVHHLIPLAYHYKFDKSLDVPENIVSLCSNCHNEIHYGKEANTLITSLYNERIDKLRQAGIDISLDELLLMYKKIGNHK